MVRVTGVVCIDSVLFNLPQKIVIYDRESLMRVGIFADVRISYQHVFSGATVGYSPTNVARIVRLRRSFWFFERRSFGGRLLRGFLLAGI